MADLALPLDHAVYFRENDLVIFEQLAVKVEMDTISNPEYFSWLDEMIDRVGSLVPGVDIVEKPSARKAPPLNTAIYYDTDDYQILSTGALLRTSCNEITHAFCAFKMAQDQHSVRRDHRYVFAHEEKRTIQAAPDSPSAIAIVNRLLARQDIDHPGRRLEQFCSIDPRNLRPAVRLDDYRYTFFVWIDRRDALRCSIDRAFVTNLRVPQEKRQQMPVSEVELAIYPRIDSDVARDRRVVQLIKLLSDSLCERFHVCVTSQIKYQRAARALGIW